MKFKISTMGLGKPTDVVSEFAEIYREPRHIIDVGSGTGRNALYLAGRGHIVHCIDTMEDSLLEIKKHAEENSLTVTTAVENLFEEMPYFGKYNTVIVSLVLHYLTKTRGIEVLLHAMNTAKVGDVHVLSVITTEGDFYPSKKENYYIEPGVLRTHYADAGWNIKSYKESESTMAAKNASGEYMKNTIARIIAEKQ